MEMQKFVQMVTDQVNTFSRIDSEFCELMSKEHRTLQQSFTRLCLQWIEYVASDDYKYDLRNQASHDVCRFILQKTISKTEDFKLSQQLSLI